MDPKNSSPVVAWLASDEADYVDRPGDPGASTTSSSGWAAGTSGSSSSCGGKPWDADKLGMIMATEIFETRHRGMEFGPL